MQRSREDLSSLEMGARRRCPGEWCLLKRAHAPRISRHLVHASDALRLHFRRGRLSIWGRWLSLGARECYLCWCTYLSFSCRLGARSSSRPTDRPAAGWLAAAAREWSAESWYWFRHNAQRCCCWLSLRERERVALETNQPAHSLSTKLARPISPLCTLRWRQIRAKSHKYTDRGLTWPPASAHLSFYTNNACESERGKRRRRKKTHRILAWRDQSQDSRPKREKEHVVMYSRAAALLMTNDDPLRGAGP
jgi:hypothetical protein